MGERKDRGGHLQPGQGGQLIKLKVFVKVVKVKVIAKVVKVTVKV